MSKVRRTLASELNINTEDSSTRTRDVVVQVTVRHRGGVTITVNDGDAVITLNEAERIAFIEALGGKA